MASTSERAWKLRRLIAMSPAEVGLRVVRGISHMRARPDAPRPQEEIASPASVFADEVPQRELDARITAELAGTTGRLLPGGTDVGALTAAMRARGIDPELTVASGERILAGSVAAFGWTAIETGDAPDWHRDPVTGRAWPLDYWTDLDFRGMSELGDPRWVWEVNRHHHLVTLARAWVLSGDDRYAERVWSDIRSWVGANPPLFGINWASPLEIAIRLMSWAMAVDLIGSRGAREGDAATLITSAALQVRHLSANLSAYASSRNNHLIGEAAGLLVTGAKFPLIRGAKRLRTLGRRLVERELAAQVTADGVSREQAFHYQSFVMEFGLLSAAVAAGTGTPLAPASARTLACMARFLGEVCSATGVPPSIGDEDGGRAYELADVAGRQAPRAVAAAVALTREHDVPGWLESDVEPALWLFGPEVGVGGPERSGVEGGRLLGPGLEPSSTSFPEGGYFVVTSGDHHGVIDCGPLGYLSIAAHGHADALSLSVAHGGRWMVVDPGTYCYHRDGLWRDHFRSTVAHNTVSVDGLSQSEMLGPFMWGRRARALPMFWLEEGPFDYFEGAHDGYVGPSGTRHLRSVLFGRPGYWLIIDFLDGRGRHRVDLIFQMAPGFVAASADHAGASGEGGGSVESPAGGVRAAGVATELVCEGTVAEFRSWLPEGMDVTVIEGQKSPPRGWVSTGFGKKEPAPAVVAQGTIELPAMLVTAFVPRGGERTVTLELLGRGADGRRGAALEVTHAEGVDTVLVGEPESESEEERFRGVLGFRRRAGEHETAWGIGVEEWTSDGSRVHHQPVVNILTSGSTDGRRP